MKLTISSNAPDFVVRDIYGRRISLLDYAQKKNVLLTFFRYAGCPLCNPRVFELKENYRALRDFFDVEIIAVFDAQEENLKEYAKFIEVKFTLIADIKGELYDLYHIESSTFKLLRSMFKAYFPKKFLDGTWLSDRKLPMEGRITRITADFLIDKNSELLFVNYGEHIRANTPIKEIIKLLKED